MFVPSSSRISFYFALFNHVPSFSSFDLQWGAPQQPGYQQQVMLVAFASLLSFCIAFKSLILLFRLLSCSAISLLPCLSQWGSGGWPPPSHAPHQQQGVIYGAMHQQVVVEVRLWLFINIIAFFIKKTNKKILHFKGPDRLSL